MNTYNSPTRSSTRTSTSLDELRVLARTLLAKEQRRRRKLATGLASSASLIALAGGGLTQTAFAGSVTLSNTLPSFILMLLVFVVVGGFQTLNYLEQHALDVGDERNFLEAARQLLWEGKLPAATNGSPEDRFIARETTKIIEAERQAVALAPALWGSGLTPSRKL
ncbi:hypothetical protein [Pseudothauera lacus]|uniref:Uncharacterized protein n=1 Tax=Pseudothauera lacus TaxID=2136175 RepID=A0A2T4IFR4_9RHOO|nr:hypothetical protein [Pseudothauera lacus]PTD96622.1 hypothetical protein C8261_07350 [Pseudothauera lacus]